MLDQLEVSRRWHIALALAYVSSPALWNAGLYDFHTSTLAVPFLLVGLTAALRDDARMLALMSLVVILARDDLALAVVAPLLVGFRQSVHRRLRISLALAAVAWALIAGRFGSVNSPEQWAMHYAYLGPNSAQVLLHPLRAVGRAATRSGQART